MTRAEAMFDPLTPEIEKIIKDGVAMRAQAPMIRHYLAELHKDKVFKAEQINNFIAKCKANNKPAIEEASLLLTELGVRGGGLRPSLYYRHDVDDKSRLKGLFWMSPGQVKLYKQYRDVLIHDTTTSTNRFGMPMHCFVVVDSKFKSRLIASAVTSGETTDDYAWALLQLLTVSGNVAPAAVMLDQDPAMDAACSRILPNTHIFNCVWHAKKNRFLRLQPALSTVWDRFERHFYAATRSITPSEFDQRWDTLKEEFSTEGDSVSSYLKRLYERRHHWAWPWMRTHFTTGLQTTQRVEKMHHLTKLYLTDRSPLAEVVKATIDQSREEFFKNVQSDERSGQEIAIEHNGPTKIVFQDVIALNNEMLDTFANNKMRQEMEWSLLYRYVSSDLSTFKEHHADYVEVRHCMFGAMNECIDKSAYLLKTFL